MATEKKFLDYAGVTTLWKKIKDQIGTQVTAAVDPVRVSAENAQSTANSANALAAEAKAEIGNLRTYVGEIPDDSNSSTIIKYIEEKASEMAESSSAIEEVAQNLANYKSSNDAAVQTNTDAISTLQGNYTKLENQVDLILDNPDTEGIINSISEFTKYIEEHGELAAGFNSAISTLQTKVDTGDKTVSGYVTDALTGYATKDSVTTLSAIIDIKDTTLTGYVSAQVNSAKEVAKAYTDTTFANIKSLTNTEIDSAIAAGNNS